MGSMQNFFQTAFSVIILAGLSIGISYGIAHREEYKSKLFALEHSAAKERALAITNLPPLPETFTDLPVPSTPIDTATTATVTTATPSYTLDRYYNVVPVNPGSERKLVLLTIDDVPSTAATLEPMLATLAAHNVHALFFVIGNQAKAHPELIKEIVDGGHTIGNHTWDHADLKNATNAKSKKEIDDMTTEIEKQTGKKPLFFRPPYGGSNDYVKKYTAEQKMVFMTWSLGGEDWVKKYSNAQALTEHVLTGLAPGANILLHEHPWTRDALDPIIVGILAKGYTIVDPKDIVTLQ